MKPVVSYFPARKDLNYERPEDSFPEAPSRSQERKTMRPQKQNSAVINLLVGAVARGSSFIRGFTIRFPWVSRLHYPGPRVNILIKDEHRIQAHENKSINRSQARILPDNSRAINEQDPQQPLIQQ